MMLCCMYDSALDDVSLLYSFVLVSLYVLYEMFHS